MAKRGQSGGLQRAPTPMTTKTLHYLWLPILLALALHWLGLSWLQANLRESAPLIPMREPLFTRVLAPSTPATVARVVATPAPPKKKTATRALSAPADSPATPPGSSGQADAATAPNTPNEASGKAEPTPAIDTPPAAADAKPAPESVAQTPAPPDPPPADQPAAESATQPADPLASWPLDTRLSYKLGGFYRGELHGDARVQWQRDKANYQVKVTVTTLGLTLATLTSQGEATALGLVPRIYEEKVPGGLRRAEFNDGHVKFANGNRAPLPAGAQDTISQLIDLVHRFSTGRSALATGVPVSVWLARPGGLDEWTYDVGGLETLQTPTFGAIQAFHLTPRPLANPRGPITLEMWFAPSLQYLPVRVRIALGNDSFVDLMIDRIEQAAGAQATTRPASGSIQ